MAATTPATVSIEGSLVYGSTNTLTIELGGLLSGEFDRLEIGGGATLGGNLVVEVFNGFIPSTGDLFPILVAGDVNGTFDNESLPSGYAWGVDYNATMLSLEVLALLGDMDGDDNVTAADAPLFIQALVNRSTYDATFPLLDADVIGDINQDGTFDLGDLGAFSALLSGPASAASVPEPSTFLLATFALFGAAERRRGQTRQFSQPHRKSSLAFLD